MPPVFRFAPSPNGELHLGHALSACLNHELAHAKGGHFLLRIEDIDPVRCRPEYEAGIHEDLAWLGLTWQQPVRRQSDHVALYQSALEGLKARGLVYPSFLSRSEIKAVVETAEQSGRLWPRDPEGAPLYPDFERSLDPAECAKRINAGQRHLWRLDMRAALEDIGHHCMTWAEAGEGLDAHQQADPATWGDIVLWRWDAPSSYHLSVVLDDALQGVSEVVRGRDLFWATPIHRLLQMLLGLPEPAYRHHRLLLDENGQKLSKSINSTGLAALRREGWTPSAIRRRIGLD